MKIFLDTANLQSIKQYNDMGLLDGITTNPSFLIVLKWLSLSSVSYNKNKIIIKKKMKITMRTIFNNKKNKRFL